MTTSRNPRCTLRGYTLIELLIVVALLGLAASLLIPYLTGRTSLETQAAVRMIIADMTFAQSDAMAHQEMRRVQFIGDASGYTGYCILKISESTFNSSFNPETADYLSDPTTNSGNWIVDFVESDRFSGVTITDVNIDGGKDYITFDLLGGTLLDSTSPGTGGSLIVTSPEATYRINIAPFTGKLTVEKVD
jgi:prepilin-type N-terminal cleavage/methylation domain-containing protein